MDFGAAAALNFTVDSATQITATSPAGTGTADVTVTGSDGVSAKWFADRFAYGTTWGPLLPFAPWDQEGPIDGTTTDWNQYCPSDPTTAADRCVTGCTATAEAQVLYYWHFPQSISFSASDDYTSQGTDGPINIPGDATKYSFPSFATLGADLSAITYDGNPNEEALLSFAMGVKAQMNYSDDASGGSDASLLNTTLEGVGFSAEMQNGNGLAWTSIKPLLISNIESNQPVLLAVYGPDGGHSVVVDGYDAGNGTFHVDLGWGPGYANVNGNDDWFPLPTITAPGGISFTSIDTVIYGIEPASPTVASVSSTTAPGTYGDGKTIPIAVTFNEPVTVNTTSGRPQLTLANGGVAVYTAGSGSTTLTFDYTVAGGQSTTDLDYGSAGALGLVGGTIKNAAGTAAVLTLPSTGSDGLAKQKIVISTAVSTTPTVTGITPATGPWGGCTAVTISARTCRASRRSSSAASRRPFPVLPTTRTARLRSPAPCKRPAR